MSYGFLNRKNWAPPEVVFVTVNCPPITAGGLVQSIQVTGGVRLSVDCNVNPAASVGHERIISFPLGRSVKDTGITNPVPRSS